MNDSHQPDQQPTEPADPRYRQPGTEQQGTEQQAWQRPPAGPQPSGQQPIGQQPIGSQPADPQRTRQPQAGQQWQPYWPTQSWPAPPASWWTPPGTAMPPTPPAPPTGPQAGQGPAPDGRRRRHRAVPALVAAALVVAAAAGGVGIGHVVWPGTQSASGNPIELSTGSAQNGGSGNGSASGGSSSGSGTGQGGASSPGSGPAGTDNGTGGSGSAGSANNGGSTDNGSGGTSQNGNGNGSTNGGGTENGNGGDGAWPPELLPGGILPGPGQWPGEGSGAGGEGSPSSGTITSAPGAPDDVSGILNKVDDAVVDINVTFKYQQAAGAGTGIVLTSTGKVLTNNHVIDGATSISVTDIGNGKTYQASVVGYDKTDDIAVLQLKNASGLETATIDSDGVAVGDAIVGIGNAGGVGGTPSAAGGSVTALNQTITVGDEMYGTTEKLNGLIEVNANIQSGDSGGPLVDGQGEVVGVDTAASTQPNRDGSSQGYAIPIDSALSIVKTIESGTGTKTIHVGPTAAIGVLISTADRSATGVQPGRIGGDQSGTKGALVAGVIAGGAAAKAGLAEGDIITSLGGHAVNSSKQLSTLMSGYHPGQTVKLGWTDTSGQAHSETITLGTGPAA